MIVVGITEAKRRFEELVEAAERGERVVVTRYGRPVFDIVKSSTATLKDRAS